MKCGHTLQQKALLAETDDPALILILQGRELAPWSRQRPTRQPERCITLWS